MPSFEQELLAYLRQRGVPFHQHVDDRLRFQRLDFGFGDAAQKRYFRFDAKEKRQPYNLKNWPDAGIPEAHVFILDDLAARKILGVAPNSGLVVRDNVRPGYYLFTVVDLFLMPKVRVNRTLAGRVSALKGKWLIDLRNGQRYADLDGVFAGIEAYLDGREVVFGKEIACVGDYVGEQIGQGGITRRPEHWASDVSDTR